MHMDGRMAAAAGLICALVGASTAVLAQSSAASEAAPAPQTSAPPAPPPAATQTAPQTSAPPAAPPGAPQTSSPSAPAPAATQTAPQITVLNDHDVEGVLGREVRSATDEDMGRIVDVLVDRTGQVRAAIIDFGGFLGVGSRKIAVDWNALHFPSPGKPDGRVTLELTRDQVKAAPEYQEGKQVVVLGALGKLEPLPPE